jgi:hypothetical protein
MENQSNIVPNSFLGYYCASLLYHKKPLLRERVIARCFLSSFNVRIDI